MAVRAVIDTNVWVSAILNPFGFPASLRTAFATGLFEVVVSEPLLSELADVLNRPRIRQKYGLTADDIAEILTLIDERAEHAILTGAITVCRDPDDDAVIETAIRGEASCIVSRDDDLKFDASVADFLKAHDIAVVTISRFLSLIADNAEADKVR